MAEVRKNYNSNLELSSKIHQKDPSKAVERDKEIVISNM